MRRALLLLLSLAAACSAGGGAAAPGAPGASATSASTAPAPPPTASPATPNPATTASPAPSPAIGPSAGCDGFPSGQAAAPVQKVVCVHRGGEAPVAAVLESKPGGAAAQFGIELFSPSSAGWRKLADLGIGPGGRGLVGAEGQVVDTLLAVDFDGDGTESLVLAVLSVGASAGPLEIDVLSFRGVDVAVDFEEGTISGGHLSVDGRSLLLETGSYAPGDPHCCPSGTLHQRIGWNPQSKRVEVVEQSVTPN